MFDVNRYRFVEELIIAYEIYATGRDKLLTKHSALSCARLLVESHDRLRRENVLRNKDTLRWQSRFVRWIARLLDVYI